MKVLLILRHAKSSWQNASLSDHDRPLKKRGKQDAPRMGRLLRDKQLVPDLIISSSAKRALATAEAVADACGYEGITEVDRSFYLADPQTYIERVREVPKDTKVVLVVGHNPGMEALLEELTGQWERLPTAALAQVHLPIDTWKDLNEETDGHLVALWLPRELA